MRMLLLWSVLSTAPALAGTTPLFKQDGSQATILLAGLRDPDPIGFYEAMAAAPEEVSGKNTKRLTFNAADGTRAFDVVCVVSKLVPDQGTCTLIFRNVPGTVDVVPSQGRARLWASGPLATQLAAAFVARDEGTILFRSSDGHLNVSVARDRGVITDFVIDFNAHGRAARFDRRPAW